MSEWITDRRPTEKDADCSGCVLVTDGGKVILWYYYQVTQGTPWIPLAKPKPYVAPKCYVVFFSADELVKQDRWVVYRDVGGIQADNLPTREAAERIAAIYNEVVP